MKPNICVHSINWLEPAEPNKEIPYNHCIGITPFGEIVITWKEWKEFHSYEVEGMPWDSCLWFHGNSLKEAKALAQDEYDRVVLTAVYQDLD